MFRLRLPSWKFRKSLKRQPAPAASAAPSFGGERSAVLGACPLAACASGSRATVLAVRCSEADACRLRALGLCEGASVSVVEARNCMLLDVRGARLALGRALTAGITVLPLQS